MRIHEFAALIASPGSWACTGARRIDDRALEVSYARGEDWLRVRVMMTPTRERSFSVWPHCAVRYEGHLASPDQQSKQQVSEILENVGARADRYLAGDATRTFGSLFEREGGTRELDPSLEGLQRWLGLAHGQAILDDFVLARVRRVEADLVLDFVCERDGELVSLRVSQRPLAESAQIDLAPETLHPSALTIRTVVRYRAMKSCARLPRVGAAGHELKLNINSACGQACEFCSIPKGRETEPTLESVLAKVHDARDAGIRILRVTGIDPLAFSGILELLRAARDAGFETLELHGPSVRLADEGFCRAVLEAAPPQRWFHVPLYGADAQSHDAVVGSPGAFARVMRALDNLQNLEPRRCVTLHTVCTKRVLPSLAGIFAIAKTRDLSFAADLAFPELEADTDPFVAVAPRQSDVAEALVHAGLTNQDLARVSGLWPCVLHRHLASAAPARAAELRTLAQTGALHPPAVGARTPMVKCPHAATCAWVPSCSGEVLRAYVSLHGDGELERLPREELA